MLVEVINLNKSFDEKKVLDNISFKLNEGNITGLVGRNGSGKTTLLKIIVGIYKHDSGKVKICGNSLEINPKTIEHIAYLPDRFDYFDYNKVKNIPDFYEILYPNFDREFFINEISKNNINLNQSVRNFSKGEKNLLGLITVLASNTKVILIDEILDGMDVINKRLITNYLLDAKDKGCAVFASSHELSDLTGICDNILYLSKDGKLSSTSEENNLNLHKIQLVVKDNLPNEIKEKAIILSNIGRVYTLLIDSNKEDLEKILADENVVQYDNLEIKVEDYFYLEEGARKWVILRNYLELLWKDLAYGFC